MCYFCENEVENKEHFMTKCPLYTPQIKLFENVCSKTYPLYKNLTGELVMSYENKKLSEL